MDSLVVVIPARGGSQRIKGKNIRPLASKPLVHHAIEYALQLEPRVIIVSTDSDEVVGVVRTRHPDVRIDRGFKHTDTSTVDELTEFYLHSSHVRLNDILVVIQPTMIGNVVECIQTNLQMRHSGEWWRIQGIRVVDGPRSDWKDLQTSGLIDIDTMEDFARAETYLRKKTTIGIYYKAGEKQGWGHEKRSKALANALQDYDVTCMSEYDQAVISGPHSAIWKDITILDVGDTHEPMVDWYRHHSKVITIEDNGPGARLAHASINPFTDLKYAVLRPEFYNLPEYVVRENVDRIMLSFGGQDNHHILGRVRNALVDWLDLLHDAHKNVALGMHQADLLICAGGQTSVEAIKVGVPTIVIPSLPTEAMRPHLSPEYGIINLGLVPSLQQILEAVLAVKWDKMLREDMSNRMKATRVGDGALHIRRIIEDLCQR